MNRLKRSVIVIGILVLVTLGVLFWGIGEYNKVIGMDEGVKAQWAQVENQLKRRYDLIPNLIETVKGYAKHEKELFENIAEMRTKYFSAGNVKDKVEAANQLEGALSKLLFLKETYPTLKANESFLKLQDSLEGTENRITVERKRYNDDVRVLNTYRRTVTGSIISSVAKIGEATYYKVPEAQQENPQVKF
ncbi:MAG: LemA family protein [Deltaproteobacteria bacterium]|nr:LemA family protein [Deltaproteobacteria bacterium]